MKNTLEEQINLANQIEEAVRGFNKAWQDLMTSSYNSETLERLKKQGDYVLTLTKGGVDEYQQVIAKIENGMLIAESLCKNYERCN